MARKSVAKPIEVPRRKCGAMEVHYHLLEQTPGYRQVLGRLEAETQSRMRSAAAFKIDKTIAIPVIVHVVHRLAKEKISAAQVKSQIDVLNRDFNASNPDVANVPSVWHGSVGNARIKFAVATKTPDGKKTSGIIYKKTAKSSFTQNDSVKYSKLGGSDAWPTDRYLNIWVCSLGSGLLGYAQFPGGPPDTDGVVILNTAFGTSGTAAAPFNLGRTATHEIGHWLNLRHIWGDTEDCSGTDFVGDTPNQQFPNRGTPTFPVITCNNGANGDMFMNYMDYVDDVAMFMFTQGQVTRMHAAIEALRPLLMEQSADLAS
jgi:hypothetical protein